MHIDHIEEVQKNIDRLEHIEKFNPNHGKDGKFVSASGGTAGATANSGAKSTETKTFRYNNKRCHATIIPGMKKEHLMGDEKHIGEMDGYDIYQIPSPLFDQHGFIGIKKSIDSIEHVEKFNPFHDRLGRFSNAHGMASYSANPKTKAGANAINRSNAGGHGRVLNVHRESKGESISQNANWLATGQKPAVPAATRRAQYQQRKLKQQQAAAAAGQNAQPQQNTKPQNTNTKSSVSSGKADNAVNGKDLSGQFTINHRSSEMPIEQVIKAQGFDGKPTVTNNSKDFSDACKASNFIAKRGVGASDQKTMDSYDDALKNGDFYVKCKGGSVHGYGMYAASLPANAQQANLGVQHANGVAKAYASGNRVQKIYTFTLDKSANVTTEKKLQNMMAKDTAFRKMAGTNWDANDVGVYAAYKGYDAYIANGGRSKYSGSHSDYTVILNRSKVIIFEP